MAKLTKAKQVELRESTYREIPQRCGTCRYGAFPFPPYSGACVALTVRGRLLAREIEQYGVCDLWEPGEAN